jgi:hypothetical protein
MVILSIIMMILSFTEEEMLEYERHSYESMQYDHAVQAVRYGDVTQLTQVFSDFDLARLDAQKLRLLRNMIYAQYGYSFKSNDLQEWFSAFDWYLPHSTNVDEYLTWVDSLNIERILRFEAAYKENENVVDVDVLVGTWHVSPIIAAGYNDLLYLFADGTFIIEFNQMDGGKRLLSMAGNWEIKGHRLLLKVNRKSILSGGEIVEPYASYGSDYVIEGGTTTNEELTKPEILSFPLTAPEAEHITDDYSMERISIGVCDFWKISDDPNTELH